MKGSNILIGIVMFAIITSGLWFFATDLADSYNVEIDAEYMDQFNQISDLQNEITEPMLNKTQGSSGVEEGTNAVKISSGVYGGMKYIYNIPSFVIGLVNNIASMLGVPGWFVGAFMVILTISITFYIISAVFGREL